MFFPCRDYDTNTSLVIHSGHTGCSMIRIEVIDRGLRTHVHLEEYEADPNSCFGTGIRIPDRDRGAYGSVHWVP